jgi:serine/threonine protein phosphatase 1
LRDKRDRGFIVVHGHSPVREGPDIRPNRINVDTGAVYGSPLSCIALGDGEPRILQVW